MNELTRREILIKNGVPRYVRCYDNEGPGDHITVVYTGRYRHKTNGEFMYVGMNAYPFHPMGIGQHGSSPGQIDKPKYAHLGKPISFVDLPEDCKRLVLSDYAELWDLKEDKV